MDGIQGRTIDWIVIQNTHSSIIILNHYCKIRISLLWVYVWTFPVNETSESIYRLNGLFLRLYQYYLFVRPQAHLFPLTSFSSFFSKKRRKSGGVIDSAWQVHYFRAQFAYQGTFSLLRLSRGHSHSIFILLLVHTIAINIALYSKGAYK